MKLKIDTETLIEEFFEDTRLFGIMAPVKDYVFSRNVNLFLNHNFRINHNMEIKLVKKERQYHFAIFEYAVSGCCMVHYIYNNRHDGEFLLPEFKNLDFLWLAKGEPMSNDEANVLSQSLKMIPGVQLVTEMTDERFRNKQYLIF